MLRKRRTLCAAFGDYAVTDFVVEKTRRIRWWHGAILLLVALALVVLLGLLTWSDTRGGEIVLTYSDDDSRAISARAQVVPKRVLVIPSIVSGRVGELGVGVGDVVASSQRLAELENPDLLLRLISQESELSRQMNEVQSAKYNAVREGLTLKLQLSTALMERDIAQLNYNRLERLAGKSFVSDVDLNEASIRVETLREQAAVIAESLEQTNSLRAAQIESLEESGAPLEESLNVVRNLVEMLEVRSSRDGRILELMIEEGQYVDAGEEIARLAVGDEYLLEVSVDEYFLEGLRGDSNIIASVDGLDEPLTLVRDSGVVVEGMFLLHLEFPHSAKVDRSRFSPGTRHVVNFRREGDPSVRTVVHEGRLNPSIVYRAFSDRGRDQEIEIFSIDADTVTVAASSSNERNLYFIPEDA